MNLLQFWQAHAGELGLLLRQHLLLVAVSTVAAICIGIPAGVLAVRLRLPPRAC